MKEELTLIEYKRKEIQRLNSMGVLNSLKQQLATDENDVFHCKVLHNMIMMEIEKVKALTEPKFENGGVEFGENRNKEVIVKA